MVVEVVWNEIDVKAVPVGMPNWAAVKICWLYVYP
jgi:hypothetical protein